MAEILTIEGSNVKIGKDDGKVITVPIASIHFANPQIGDEVDVYEDGSNYIIKKKGGAAAEGTVTDGEGKSINKHLFVWLCNFMFGYLGVDRFVRGQVGLGILKLVCDTIGWVLIIPPMIGGIWAFVDWIISLTKAYGQAFGKEDNLVFDEAGKYIR